LWLLTTRFKIRAAGHPAALEKGEKIMCNKNCSICPNIVISDAVTFAAGTLTIDIPANSFKDGQRLCLIVAQTIPDATTITAPVVITIGGDATVTYPLVRCDCAAVTASAIRTRTRYPLKVSTSATGAVFKVLGGLSCAPSNTLASIPAPTA
jgi:hypothetical protein